MNDIVLLNLRISMWGVSRVLPDHEYEVDADKAMVRATKKILECPEYEFLLQLKRSIHRRLKTLALPGEILRAGVYPVSVGMVEEVEKELEAFSVRWGVGVLALEQVWDLRVREVEDRLRALYDEEDYPSWERVRGCFAVRWNYFSMSTPQVLQAISGKLFVREQAKATVQWNEMLEEIRDGLRLTFKELVDALVDRLSPGPDGTRKKLVGVDRLLEFLDTFSKKDVADDEQLRVLVEARTAQRPGRVPAAQGPGAARVGAGADAEREGGAGHAGGGCTGEADCVAGVNAGWRPCRAGAARPPSVPGSPPRTWGRRGARHTLSLLGRFTPTHVGKASSPS